MELLSPAGNIAKLKTAFLYGADAVYLGSAALSMRAGGGAEFNDELSLAVGINYAHALKKRVYLAANIFPHNCDLNALREVFILAERLKPDGIIVSDLGAFDLCQQYAPSIPIHISTQANNVNWRAAKKWHELGAKRIILARELSFDEMREIRENTPPSLELEAFVHGAMCVAYSGRCLLSQYLTNRDANKGECAQPCRWAASAPTGEPVVHGQVAHECRKSTPGEGIGSSAKNAVTGEPVSHGQTTCETTKSASEQTDQRCMKHLPAKGLAFSMDGENFVLEETQHGTFLLNSKDLCLIRHIAKLAECGVDSLKIEGRNKSEYYVAAVTKAYRTEVNRFLTGLEFDPKSLEELEKISHREYCDGLENTRSQQIYGTSSYIRSAEVVAVVEGSRDGFLECAQRGKIISGDDLEILTPTGDNVEIKSAEIRDFNTLNPIYSTPHAEMRFLLACPVGVPNGSFVRTQIR